MKIMSYNIHHGACEDENLDLARIGEVIKQSGAQIIGLQEVDSNFSERSGFVDQTKWLATELGMDYTFKANLDYDPLKPEDNRRQYGIAVLSAYPIRSAEHHLLTSVSEQRGLLETIIDVNGDQLYFF